MQTLRNKQKEEAERVLKEGIKKVSDLQSAAVVVPEKKPLKTRIWEELVHYYDGFRLLIIDFTVSNKILWRLLLGYKLTRRESRLLVRTTTDMFRLLPFSLFVIIPFMELLLPVFIKLFPGMLPSTFQTSNEREDKLKASLKVKLEVAKFLQKTLDGMAVHNHGDQKSEDAANFSKFFKKIRTSGEYVTNDDIIKFSTRFKDEITLDSLSREQIVALCRVLEIPTYATTNILRFQLHMKMRSLAADDLVIHREGVGSLNITELQQACKSRGMRAYGMTPSNMRQQLQNWIDLSLNEKVPPILLLLSRALMVSDEIPTSEQLKETIRCLPDVLEAQTKDVICELEGKIDNKSKIKVIKEEERKIKEELEEEKQGVLDGKMVIVTKAQSEDVLRISPGDAELICSALDSLRKQNVALLIEKEAIKELKQDIKDYKEDVEMLHVMRTLLQLKIGENRAAKILFKKMNTLIGKIDKNIIEIEFEKKEKLRAGKDTSKHIPSIKDGHVKIQNLMNAIKEVCWVTKFKNLF